MQLLPGSGKTAVLVARIIRKIIDQKIDIDKILVVTFTNAAASEMRERILDAIYQKIDENPDDENLQRQINLLNKANICTIDSFCLDVIRNNFFEINVSANARIADSTEINLLKQETLEEIFEEKYMNEDKGFLTLIDTYTKYNRDEDLENLIFKLYNYIQTSPFPEEWLNDKIEMFNPNNQYKNFSDSIWGKIIINNVNEILTDAILREENILKEMQKFPELEKFINRISEDIINYRDIQSKLFDWNTASEMILTLKNEKWPVDKKVDNPLKARAKEIRDSVKKDCEALNNLMPYTTEQANCEISYMYNILIELKKIIIEFIEKFNQKKREKNIMDFNDMEHLALKILLKKDEKGNIEKTDVAKEYAKKFQEIAIDEYQDSNLVQEYILNSVSNGNNMFMVGDVKQSIYKFRQARPELFLNKYDTYKINPDDSEDRKITLFKNFRSRQNILDVTNIIFKNIMSKELGNINYNENEYLNPGAIYESIENQDLKTELNIIDLKEKNDNVWKNDSDNNSDTEETKQDSEETEMVEDVVLEARFVANRIKQLIDSKYQIIDKKNGKRDIKYKDIAVLLRSANTLAPIYEKEIADKGIIVYSDSSEGYLQSIEVETMMSLLKIINNPMQDIPLVTVLRSIIGNFSDNELIEISLEKNEGKRISFYEKLINTKNDSKNMQLVNKITRFLHSIAKWREEEKYKPLDELIWQIYEDTGYVDYVSLMPNGELRSSNLKMLFERAKQYESASFKGLYNFINFIDKIKLSSGDLGAAKIIGENENVVRIMSIHKSKGLEFPVVIFAGCGKNFNLQDLNDKLLLHQDIGLGPQYIDAARHIESKTLAKSAISLVSKQEIISEEMRVLYVALTRAKEKLIIVGKQKDVNKSFMNKEKNLETYAHNEKINTNLVKKCKSYLDWLELVYINEGSGKLKDLIELNIIPKDELLKNITIENKKEDIKYKIDSNVKNLKNDEQKDKIRELLNWKYPFDNLKNIPSKTSVTKIKEINNKTEISRITDKPKFLNENDKNKLTGAEKGTLMHLCVQKMNEKKHYDINEIKSMIEDLVDRNIITKLEADNINVEKLLAYTDSKLWNELSKAQSIYKEQPFYINLPASKLYDSEDENDNDVLVQGIIDLYYIDKDGKLILVDYKTDYIENGKEQEIIEKYKSQLEIYKEALEQSLNRKVDRTEIFSLYLNKILEEK